MENCFATISNENFLWENNLKCFFKTFNKHTSLFCHFSSHAFNNPIFTL